MLFLSWSGEFRPRRASERTQGPLRSTTSHHGRKPSFITRFVDLVCPPPPASETHAADQGRGVLDASPWGGDAEEQPSVLPQPSMALALRDEGEVGANGNHFCL
eukprot:750920-Hanusia_phi.AAC.4